MQKVLTIAGSDSGGGAGIQADIKTCQALGVYSASVITALTAQNTREITAVAPVERAMIRAQLDAVFNDIHIDVVKTGMLANKGTIQLVVNRLRAYEVENLVVDPVITSTSGTVLLTEEGLDCLRTELLPLASVLTPNIDEAALLLGESPTFDIKWMKQAAKRLQRFGPQIVIVKGGHLEGSEAVDVVYDGTTFTMLQSSRIHTSSTHGTGCTFAAAVAASLAKGMVYKEAFQNAKLFTHTAIAHAFPVGTGKGPLNHYAHMQTDNKGVR
ncbi:bifunctional hydroxymethylpyrimidine kinase/phosphomethylpyrimidine kinase [Bacillus sp. FSL W7-1360]